METSDDRKYVCVRRLAVPKRHNFCSSSSSLATSNTGNHFLRLVDTIPRAPRRLPYTSKSFWAPSSNLGVLFQSSEILVSKGRAISIMRQFPSFFSITTMSGLFVWHRQICLKLEVPQFLHGPIRRELHSRSSYGLHYEMATSWLWRCLIISFHFLFCFLLCMCVCVFLDYGYLVKLNIFTFQMRLGINCLCRTGVLIFIGL